MSNNELRDLSSLKLQVAKSTHSLDNWSVDSVSQLPLAAEQHKKYTIPLICTNTGLVVGTFNTIAVAGSQPLLGQWKNTQILHPLFSLTPVALLQFSRNAYVRFCALTPEEAASSEVVAQQERLLRVSALCMLHHLTEVKQDIPWMPEWTDVAAHWTSLMAISYWRAYLDSDRFKFPRIRISKLENRIELGSFLQLCWQRKKEYESGVSDRAEAARAAIAEKAMVSIRDAISGMRPLSPRILYRWFEQNMPARYEKDLIGWMWELFTASEKTVQEFTLRDVDMFEEIFLTECPTGSSISHAFLEVLRSKRKMLETRLQTFEILVPNVVQEAVDRGEIDVANAPKLQDYPNRAAFLIATSKWKLAQPSMTKHRDKELDRQQNTMTVKPSFVPKFSPYQSAIDADEGEDDE